jgi:uncharacterized protein (TIGR02300 family)
MTKPELGTKRLCANCSARYYDLNKTPITCPKCGTPFEVVATTTQKRFGQRAVVSQPEVEPEEVPSETKVISLEEVETEDVETDESDETAKDDSEDTLIEEVEEEDTDVSEIIGGDIEDKEDT